MFQLWKQKLAILRRFSGSISSVVVFMLESVDKIYIVLLSIFALDLAANFDNKAEDVLSKALPFFAAIKAASFLFSWLFIAQKSR